MVVLAFDVGKSKCRLAAFEDDQRLAEAKRVGSIGLDDRGGAGAALDAMADVASQVSLDRADAVCAGLAGFGQAREQAHRLAAGLSRRFSTKNVVLVSDITISHAAGYALALAAVASGRRIFGDGPFEVATAGGLFESGSLLLDPFKAELKRRAPASNLCAPQGDALDGAHLIATSPSLPHVALTLRPLQRRVSE